MSEQAIFTLGEAAKATGRSKSTISKAIDNGRLSVMSKEGGSYQIAAAELFRVFPPNEANGVEKPDGERLETPETERANRGLEIEIAALKDRLALIETMHDRERRLLSDRIDELREDRDAWKGQAERATLLLEHQRETAATPPAEPVRRGFRFLGLEIRRNVPAAS